MNVDGIGKFNDGGFGGRETYVRVFCVAKGGDASTLISNIRIEASPGGRGQSEAVERCVNCWRLRCQGVDQASAIRSAPAGDQVIAFLGRICAIAATADVMKAGGITLRESHCVKRWVEEAEG